MSLEGDYREIRKNIDNLNLTIVKLAMYHTQYAFNSEDKPVKNETGRAEAREGIRETLIESKQLLESLIKNYPI